MNADALFAHFDQVISAPDAVPRLRRFILDLAVRGKLVPQNPTDEPASEFLDRVSTKKEKSSVTEWPYALPESWIWARLEDVAEFSAGRTPPRKDMSYWNNGVHAWVSIADMKDGELLMTTREAVSEEARSDIFRSAPKPPGTMLMSFKLTIGKIVWLGIPAYHNEAIISLHPHQAVLDSYLFKVLPKFAQQGDLKGAIKGATLNRNSLSNIPMPLPPLAEQHRIVAKVDELMTLCDDLEATEKEQEKTRNKFTSATHARLTDPTTTPEDFQHHTTFTLKNFPALTTHPTQIKTLRETILTLAVQGKLVPQDSTEENAGDLLEQMKKRKEELVQAGGVRKLREGDNAQSLIPFFEVPPCWRWTRLDVVGFIVGGGTPRANDPENFATSGDSIPWLTPADLGRYKGLYVSKGARDLSDKGYQESSAKLMPAGTILFSSRAPIGYVAIAQNEISTNQGFKSIVPYIPECSRFIALVLKTFTSKIEAEASGTTFKEASGRVLSKFPFPLPPLSEQRRIVEKVDELMSLCDNLAAEIGTNEVMFQHLWNTIENSLEAVEKSD